MSAFFFRLKGVSDRAAWAYAEDQVLTLLGYVRPEEVAYGAVLLQRYRGVSGSLPDNLYTSLVVSTAAVCLGSAMLNDFTFEKRDWAQLARCNCTAVDFAVCEKMLLDALGYDLMVTWDEMAPFMPSEVPAPRAASTPATPALQARA